MGTAFCTAQAALFDDVAAALPPGLSFDPCFISAEEERALLALAAALPLREARYKTYTARRRVHAFGMRADGSDDDGPAAARPPIAALPAPLLALRDRLAAWVGIPACDFVQVMVAEYQTGTPLGWHRDAPAYELIAGVSLGSPARLRFRPWPPAQPSKHDIVALDLAPRSAYVMRDTARWGWQHSVPPVAALRYVVTMRTARR